MKRCLATLAALLLVAACSDGLTEPSVPLAPEAIVVFSSSSSASSITLGSGMGVLSGAMDDANRVKDCGFEKVDSKDLRAILVCPPDGEAAWGIGGGLAGHYASPLLGTTWISPVKNFNPAGGGYACCTEVAFENEFELPGNLASATISITIRSDNAAGIWVNGELVGKQPCFDQETLPNSGCNTAPNWNPGNSFSGVQFTPITGTNTLRIVLRDTGGAMGLNYRATVEYELLDTTPPVITADVDGTLGDNGWYISDVTVSWTVDDPESEETITAGCVGGTVDFDTDGTTFICEAESAGGETSESVTIMRDATPPDIAFDGNAGSYTVDQTVDITCGASDEMSGLASEDCPGASGQAYTFGLGTTNLDASAKDNAGNGNSLSTHFTVSVTPESLCSLVRQWVTQRGVANALCQQLTQGRNGTRSFINTVRAQTGGHVPAEYAPILIDLAGAL